MNITIEQTLHGYENGHQLLTSSIPLLSDARQTLLVQSDLSGSNIDENFKSYISGYPLSDYYAFSKTWYAEEMRRPGCVWTHTLLISFSDLGKIVDLEQLTKFFKRPIKEQYKEYSNQIILERAHLENSSEVIDKSELMTRLLLAVYDKPDRTILLPSNSSTECEKEILQLWSNQWPRLRRSFCFCTGALSLKLLEGREFDLQVIPYRNLPSVEKQSLQPYVIDVIPLNIILKNHWIATLYNSQKNTLRRFLWLYGSDIEGNRKNYKPLILLYSESLKEESNFNKVVDLINHSFSNKDGAFRLKKEIFENKIFNFNERELLTYILQADILNSDFGNFDLSQRLLNAYKSNAISLHELVEFYLTSPKILSDNLWDEIASDDKQLISLLTLDHRLLNRFSSRILNVALNEDTWKTPYDFQISIIKLLENSNDTKWDKIIICILKAKSDVIFDAIKNNDYRFFIAMSWMNDNDYNVLKRFEYSVFVNYKRAFIEFAKRNKNSLSSKTSNKIFQNFNYSELNSLGFTGQDWLKIYRKISDENVKIFAACSMLSFGFDRKVVHPYILVSGCFSDVYYFAKSGKVTVNLWKLLPVDMSEEKYDEYDPISAVFDFFNFFSPKKSDVPSWDYCELLIRTLVNKFIKNKWPLQAFLDSLATEFLTHKAIQYSLSFKKGEKFTKALLSDVHKKRIKPSVQQLSLISKISREIF